MIATKALLSNPAVRKAALGAAAAIAGGIVRRTQQRRARKRAPARSRVATMPAAYNVSNQSLAGRIRLSKREKCGLPMDCEPGDNGALHSYRLSPRSADLFPVLSQMVGNYTKYRFVRFSIEYVPRVGTQNSGTVYFGWQPQCSYTNADFPSVEVVSAMPKSGTTSIRQGATFEIPLTSPPEKYVNIPADSTYDPLNYYNGHLIVTAQGPAEEEVGELWVNYVVELIQAKRDVSNPTSSALFFPVYGPTYHIYSEGKFNAQSFNDGTSTWLSYTSVIGCTLIVKTHALAGTDPVNFALFDHEDVEIAASDSIGSAAQGKHIFSYNLGVHPRLAKVRAEVGAGVTNATCVLLGTVTSFAN